MASGAYRLDNSACSATGASNTIESLLKEHDAINEGFRDCNPQQVAIEGVAPWVSQDGTLDKSFYRAKVEPKPKATSTGPMLLYSNSLFAERNVVSEPSAPSHG